MSDYRIAGLALLAFAACAGIAYLVERRRKARQDRIDLAEVERILALHRPKPRHSFRRKGRFARNYGSFKVRDNFYGN